MKSKYIVKTTAQFRKNYKAAEKSCKNMKLLEEVITKLALGIPLPEKNRDHALSGTWSSYRECHISPDWLLIYKQQNDILVLTLARIGTHSKLFGR